MKKLVSVAFLAIFALAFSACSKPIYKIQTQEVFIPVKCDLELPQKPKENGSFKCYGRKKAYFH